MRKRKSDRLTLSQDLGLVDLKFRNIEKVKGGFQV